MGQDQRINSVTLGAQMKTGWPPWPLRRNMMMREQQCCSLYLPPMDCPESDSEIAINLMLTMLFLLFILGMMGLVLRQWIRAVRKSSTLEVEVAALIVRQVEEAQAFSTELRTPFVLMRASDFLKLKRLRSQEELRDQNCLLYLDTLDEATQFLSAHISVFFSHQWLGWYDPDPDRVQYQVMCAALHKVRARESMKLHDLHKVFVWVDFFSIPQKCTSVQKLAVEQLGTLASVCSYFIVAAPDAYHANTGEQCNQETYHARCWCRAEIFSHWARRGCATFGDSPCQELQNMFYMTDNGLEPMVPVHSEGDGQEHGSGQETPDSPQLPGSSMYSAKFLESINVFNGDLTCCKRCNNGGIQPCDRETLMLPMLGLYTEIYDNRDKPAVKDMYAMIAQNIDGIFPQEFEYTIAEGQTVTKPLFGDLIQAVEAVVEAVKSTESDEFRCSTPRSRPRHAPADTVESLGKLHPGALRSGSDTSSYGSSFGSVGLSSDNPSRGLHRRLSRGLSNLSEVGRGLPTLSRGVSDA